jgi:hypothetical protein
MAWWLGGLLFLPLSMGSFSRGAEGDSWKAHFFHEAPATWESFLDFCRKHQFQVHYQIRQAKPRTVYASWKGTTITVKRAKGAILYTRERRHDGGTIEEGEVQGMNHLYSFYLTRASQSNKPWLVRGIYTTGKDKEEMDQALSQLTERWGVARILMIWNLWLPELIRDPDFHVHKVEAKEQGGRVQVRLEFGYPKPRERYPLQGTMQLIRGGWIVLEPEMDWLPVAYEVYSEDKGEKYYYSQEWQIVQVDGGHPSIARSNVRSYSGTTVFVDGTLEYTMWEEEVPLEEFTLSAFGFPEPPLGGGGRPWYVWLAWGGILFLLLGLLSRWLLRRRAAGAG